MLAVLAEILEPKKGEKVFSMDQPGNQYFYILFSGKLSLSLKGRRGVSKDIETKGDLFGEIAIFSEKYRLGTIECKEDAILVAFNKDKILSREYISSQVALKICMLLTKKIAKYLYTDENVSIQELIARGECETVEFKRDLNENKQKVLETITAFMNLNGGTILIGVEDSGDIKGIKLPRDKSGLNNIRDEYERKILDSLKTKIDKYFLDLVKIDWEDVNDHYVMRIDCFASDSPVFFKEFIQLEEKEYYIIRSGSTNMKLSRTSEIVPHIIKRYKQ